MSGSGKCRLSGEELVDYEWDETTISHLEESLSECGRDCIPKFNTEAKTVPPKIDLLISIVCRIFDEMKNDFVRQLECAKEELLTSVSEHNAQWIEASRKIKALDKISAVKNRFFKSLATDFHFDLNLVDQ